MNSLLSRCGLNAKNVNLEITETRYIEEHEERWRSEQFKSAACIYGRRLRTGNSSLEPCALPLDG